MPYVIRLVLASFSYVNRDIENAAKTLGASPVRTFFEVTMPLVAPGVIVSAVFGFMVSFTDVVIATFVAGARYITFPVRVYSQQRSEGIDPMTIAISAVIMAAIIVLALVGEKFIHWSRYV
jgi:putative spermidine/putrescine transport system permease protein